MVNITEKMFAWHAETFITQENMNGGVKLPGSWKSSSRVQSKRTEKWQAEDG